MRFSVGSILLCLLNWPCRIVIVKLGFSGMGRENKRLTKGKAAAGLSQRGRAGKDLRKGAPLERLLFPCKKVECVSPRRRWHYAGREMLHQKNGYFREHSKANWSVLRCTSVTRVVIDCWPRLSESSVGTCVQWKLKINIWSDQTSGQGTNLFLILEVLIEPNLLWQWLECRKVFARLEEKGQRLICNVKWLGMLSYSV